MKTLCHIVLIVFFLHDLWVALAIMPNMTSLFAWQVLFFPWAWLGARFKCLCFSSVRAVNNYYFIYRFLTWGLLNTRGLDYLGIAGLSIVLMVVSFLEVLLGKGIYVPMNCYLWRSYWGWLSHVSNFSSKFFTQDYSSILGGRTKDCEEGFEAPKGKGKASNQELDEWLIMWKDLLVLWDVLEWNFDLDLIEDLWN